MTYYNTDILKKAGVDYTKIKTWADYTKAGEQVKAKTGKYMTELEYSASFQLDAMTSQQHADYIKGSKADLDNAAVTRALQMQKDWIYKDKIARAAVGGNLDNDQYFAEMNKGNVASVTMRHGIWNGWPITCQSSARRLQLRLCLCLSPMTFALPVVVGRVQWSQRKHVIRN
ncbi:extracellular solute-binding protein [Lacticaseibacillus nasuensis]|uniref:extracellular solute-binding protein n=1 Tax=Lacticaseibacillus nasuensis TaxID=944671 RepID=UPI0006CFAAE8|nr:extracellular solute-binding protein [Lacticaseibacillus nasuensis]